MTVITIAIASEWIKWQFTYLLENLQRKPNIKLALMENDLIYNSIKSSFIRW